MTYRRATPNIVPGQRLTIAVKRRWTFRKTAMVVAASYLLWVQRRLFLGPVDEPANRGLIDLDRIERSVVLMMTIPIVFIGVYPNPVLRRIEPAVLEILNQMEQRFIHEDVADPDAGVEVVLIDPLSRVVGRLR